MLSATRNAIRNRQAIARNGIGALGLQPVALAEAAEADPEHADQQVDERRVDERDRDADLAAVEEEVADPEAEQDQQVEVDQLPRPAEVEEAEEEQRRERDPDVPGVQRVAELALVAARHRPGDLVAGPRLADLAGLRVDVDLDDLLVAVEVADLPLLGRLRLHPDLEALAAVGRDLGDVLVAVRDPHGLLGRDLEALGRVGKSGRWDRRLRVGGRRESQRQDARQGSRPPSVLSPVPSDESSRSDRASNLTPHGDHRVRGKADDPRRPRGRGRPDRARGRRAGRGVRAAARGRRRAPGGHPLPPRAAGLRAGQAHALRVRRAPRPSVRAFDLPSPGPASQGAPALVGRAVEAVADADRRIAELQDSMLPVESGDAELRAGLSEVRELLGSVPVGAREFLRALGR